MKLLFLLKNSLSLVCIVSFSLLGCTSSNSGSPNNPNNPDQVAQNNSQNIANFKDKRLHDLVADDDKACVIIDDKVKCWSRDSFAIQFKKKLGKVSKAKSIAVSNEAEGCVIDGTTPKCYAKFNNEYSDFSYSLKTLEESKKIFGAFNSYCGQFNDSFKCIGIPAPYNNYKSYNYVSPKNQLLIGMFDNSPIFIENNIVKATNIYPVEKTYKLIEDKKVDFRNPRIFSFASNTNSFCIADDDGIKCTSIENDSLFTIIPIKSVESLTMYEEKNQQNYYNTSSLRVCAAAQGQLKCWKSDSKLEKYTSLEDSFILATELKNVREVVYAKFLNSLCVIDDDGAKCLDETSKSKKWVIKVPKKSTDGVPNQFNPYIINVENRCERALNIESFNYLACSTQLQFRLFKVTGIQNQRNISLELLRLNGSTLKYHSRPDSAASKAENNITLESEMGDVLILQDTEFKRGEDIKEIYVSHNGNSGKCTGIVIGNPNSCSSIINSRDYNSDNASYYFDPFHVTGLDQINIGTCKLTLVDSHGKSNYKAYFSVVDDSCDINDQEFYKGDTLYYDLSDPANYPYLSVPKLDIF
ncbi:MAG: hypothetical protein JNL11_15030 [Bdellovibrionaceae bacterium]|nr:hypothetical protein [Pseudobdellovibrionaceae bacterium]